MAQSRVPVSGHHQGVTHRFTACTSFKCNNITRPPLHIWQNHTFHTACTFDTQIFSDAPDNARWIVPIHHVVVHNMVAMATQADQTLRQNGNAAPGKLSAAATYLQSSIFSETLRKGTYDCFIKHYLLVVISAGADDNHGPKWAGMQHFCIRTQSCCFLACLCLACLA